MMPDGDFRIRRALAEWASQPHTQEEIDTLNARRADD